MQMKLPVKVGKIQNSSLNRRSKNCALVYNTSLIILLEHHTQLRSVNFINLDLLPFLVVHTTKIIAIRYYFVSDWTDAQPKVDVNFCLDPNKYRSSGNKMGPYV